MKEESIERLMSKTNLSYDENKKVLEQANGDILDAFLILENEGKIEKPDVSVFYTNKTYESKINNEVEDVKYVKKEKRSLCEYFCSIIDTFNNIFFQIDRDKKVVIKLPLTVVILLLFFTFWVTVPLLIIGLFLGIEYSFWGRGVENTKINKILKRVSTEIQSRKNNKGERKV